ncbi:MAG: sporulation protein YabP [Ruminococcus sp.]|jgi:sporulation protein YabP|nr:sporulation protein YabP [Ruminococcus sp.]
MQEFNSKPQSLTLDNRKKLSLTGVEDVLGFNDETVNVKTTLGDLTIKGSKLHISKLNLDTGDVEIDGVVDLIHYSQSKSEKSFMQRLLG